MSDTVIEVKNLSKLYRLGTVGTGSLMHDVNRWWHTVRGKEDPYSLVGESNDRSSKGSSDYVWALKDINFSVKQGEVLGIIGKNGAGKSTLLKILSQITRPTSGNIKIKGRVASLLEVGTGFHPDLTGRENIYINGAVLGMKRSEIDKKLDEIIAFSGCERYIDTPTKRYSSGMTVRLGFAVAAHLEPEILIVDEVLAVGDAEFQKKALGKMQDVMHEGRTVIFVSHNLGSVRQLCNRCLFVDKGNIIHESSDVDNVIKKYLQSDRVEENCSTISIFKENEYDFGKFKFTSFFLSNEKGDVLENLVTSRSGIFVNVEGFVREEDSLLEIGFQCVDEGLNKVFVSNFNDSLEFQDRSLRVGNFKLRAKIPDNLLNNSTYRFLLAAYYYNQKVILEPDEGSTVLEVSISAKFSDFGKWQNKRVGSIAPVLEWEIM